VNPRREAGGRGEAAALFLGALALVSAEALAGCCSGPTCTTWKKDGGRERGAIDAHLEPAPPTDFRGEAREASRDAAGPCADPSWVTVSTGVSTTLNGVWGSGAGDFTIAGASGTLLRFDGSAVSSVSTGTAQNLNAVWGASASAVFVVGNQGLILSGSGSSFSPSTSVTSRSLYAVWGTGPSAVWAAGAFGTVLRYDGKSWTYDTLVTTQTLLALSGSSGSDLHAAGLAGALLHYNGASWTLLGTSTSVALNALLGSSGGAWAAGASGTILAWSGSSWSVESSPTTSSLYGLGGRTGGPIFAVGAQGTILSTSSFSSGWTAMASGTSKLLRAVHVAGPRSAVAVGEVGTLLVLRCP
jgi:hypothetical protein